MFSQIVVRGAMLVVLVLQASAHGTHTGCHDHDGKELYPLPGGEETVHATPTGSATFPTAYSECHAHGTEVHCVKPDGSEVAIVAVDGHGKEEYSEVEGHAENAGESSSGENCHFHAGVEHCTAGSSETGTCERTDRDYNVRLRIGLLFVVLVTSAIGVYAPIVIVKLLNINQTGTLFTIVKQLGTGIIIATAFIHLLTHAQLMFSNSCLGELKYEATTTAITMAGALIAFLIDFFGHRLATWRRRSVTESHVANSSSNEEISNAGAAQEEKPAGNNLAGLSHHHGNLDMTLPNDTMSVLILEAGIIFHSLLLGITLVVAGDSIFITLFIVIVLHQIFEGLALGARIAALTGLKKTKYTILPIAFALVTPTGMAIGIGVLNAFNGNDPSTIIALGTLDAVSAGILLWVGVVSIWAHDWMFGELRDAGIVKTIVALISLIAGMVLMGLLGEWA